MRKSQFFLAFLIMGYLLTDMATAKSQRNDKSKSSSKRSEDSWSKSSKGTKRSGRKSRKKGKKSRNKYQKGAILRDGTAVYEYPSFDAPIIDYKAKGQKVKVTRKLYKGRNGTIGIFYKIKLKGKRRGYIPDNEVLPQHKSKISDSSGDRDDEHSFDSGSQRANISQSRYYGVSAGAVNFTERFLGDVISESILLFGGKLTGPGALHDILPLDFELLALAGVPEYYETSKVVQTEGFMILGSVLLLSELIEARDTSVYYGLGLMYVFTQFSITAENASLDSQELRMGAALSLGVAQRLSRKIVARLEGKYYVEKEKYGGIGLSLQLEY